MLQGEDVLTSLGNSGAKLKLSKCSLFTDTVEYLVYIILPGKFEVDLTNIRYLKESRPPSNKG